MIPVFTRIFAAIDSVSGHAPLPWPCRCRCSASPASVLVFAFENQTDDRNIDWIGTGLSELVMERLSAEHDLYVFNRDERTTAYERMGIPESVGSQPRNRNEYCVGHRRRFDRDRQNLRNPSGFSRSKRAFSICRMPAPGRMSLVNGELQNLIPMATSLSFKLARQLVPWSTTPELDYIAHPPVPSSAFEAYIRGMIAADSARRIALFQDAIRLHPQVHGGNLSAGTPVQPQHGFQEFDT